jgi:4-amino-4-deoxy-L-arabinose transferase-like glycosyltransferase
MKFKLILIVLLAAALRFYQLGQVPSGFVNDEAAFGYNAYSLLKTGRDEFGQRFPIIFQSFGEGKLPVYVYLTMPSVALFGLNEFAVRLPSALLGTLTVWLVYLLVKSGKQTSSWPLLSALVLAVMPWHIHFSRAAFEANAAVFFVALATVFWLMKKYWFSLIAFIAALFTYNAARLFVPLWLVWLVFNQRHQIKYLLIFLAFWLGLFLLPQSRERLANITIFHPQSGVEQRLGQKFSETTNQPLFLVRLLHNKPVEFTWDFVRRYTTHFSPDFLFFSGDPNRPRYRVPDTGQLLWLELPLLVIGLYQLARRRQWSWLVWLILAPLPAALTFETPSAIRSILMVVPLAAAVGLGASVVLGKMQKFWPILALIFIYNLSQYLDAYFIHAPVHQPYEWQGGYKELVKRVNELMPGYERADITDSRGTAYIYFLFYNVYDPLKWQQQSSQAVTLPDKFGFTTIKRIDNLNFIGETCPAKIPEAGVLYVCTQENHPKSGFIQFEDTIDFDDGQQAFVLFEAAKAEAATLPAPAR